MHYKERYMFTSGKSNRSKEPHFHDENYHHQIIIILGITKIGLFNSTNKNQNLYNFTYLHSKCL